MYFFFWSKIQCFFSPSNIWLPGYAPLKAALFLCFFFISKKKAINFHQVHGASNEDINIRT